MDAQSKTAIRLKFAKFALKFKGLRAVNFNDEPQKAKFREIKGAKIRNMDVF